MTRLADDRAGQMSDDQVSDEIVKRLRLQAGTRSDFSKVHACVPSSDVPDEREARLVILGPDFPHANRDDKSPARRESAAILDSRGSSPRNFRNTLVFLAGDTNRLRELEQAVRQYLAWLSIWDDRVTLNLDQFQTRQAETKRKSADEAADLRITEAYHWLLVPGQPDPKGEVAWTDLKLQGQDSLATRAAKKLKNEESLISQMGGVRLRTELDRIPLWTGNHVGIKQLCEYMARYLYLPRVRDEDVILAAVRDGLERLTWQDETFAYAEGWDEPRNRYKGLRAGQPGRVVLDSESLVVRPEIAACATGSGSPDRNHHWHRNHFGPTHGLRPRLNDAGDGHDEQHRNNDRPSGAAVAPIPRFRETRPRPAGTRCRAHRGGGRATPFQHRGGQRPGHRRHPSRTPPGGVR